MMKYLVAVLDRYPGHNAIKRRLNNVTLHEILQSPLEKQTLPGQFLQIANIVCSHLQQATGEMKFKYSRNEISNVNYENFEKHIEYVLNYSGYQHKK